MYKSTGTQYQCPDEAPGGAEGTVTTEQQFCFLLLLPNKQNSALSCLAKNL